MHRWQANGSTRAHVQVHRRLPHGLQGIKHIGPHHIQEACFIGSHCWHLICIGASVLPPAPHSLHTAPRGPLVPMHQSGGSLLCRADKWLAIGLHTTQWTAEACLAAAGLMYWGFRCRLASYGAPTALGACIEHCRRCVSGGLRSQNGTCSLHQ